MEQSMNVAVIDGGTTNTRITLVDINTLNILKSIKIEQGVRNQVMNKDFGLIENLIMNEIEKLTKTYKIEAIIAYGMLTSNVGILEIPYIGSPIDIDTIANHTIRKKWNGLDSYWITGMVNNKAPLDVMRGEEVETIGMLEYSPTTTNGIVLLPGSHTKFITVLEGERITSCTSTLSGELLRALQRETILADSLSIGLTEEIEKDYLLEGYKLTRTEGLTRAMYQVRLRHLFTDYTENQRANVLLGAILHEDLKVLHQIYFRLKTDWIYLGGSGVLKQAYSILLNVTEEVPIRTFTETEMEKAALLGALSITGIYDSNKRSCLKY